MVDARLKSSDVILTSMVQRWKLYCYIHMVKYPYVEWTQSPSWRHHKTIHIQAVRTQKALKATVLAAVLPNGIHYYSL